MVQNGHAKSLSRGRENKPSLFQRIFLVAGDKAGNWDGWYRKAIPLADERFRQHLIELEAEKAEKR